MNRTPAWFPDSCTSVIGSVPVNSLESNALRNACLRCRFEKTSKPSALRLASSGSMYCTTT